MMSQDSAISSPPPQQMPLTAQITGLLSAAQFLQSAKAAFAVIAIDRIAVGGGLQVPARAEELLAGAGQSPRADPGCRESHVNTSPMIRLVS
jgi:hypothetical protein